MVQAQVLAFLGSLQASREARVREEQKERKITDVLLNIFHSFLKIILNIFYSNLKIIPKYT